MAVNLLVDLNALHTELDELVQAELEISVFRRKLHDRLASFPINEVMQRRERAVSAERQAIHRRIDELTAQLGHGI